MKHFLTNIVIMLISSIVALETNENEKAYVGIFSAQFIQDGDVVALGSGSTVKYFIQTLAKRIKKENLQIQVVSSSRKSTKYAMSLGMEILSPDDVRGIDIMVDSADQINHKKELIKGGGGALLREKLLALRAAKLIIIADQSKIVDKLSYPLPVEIEPFCYKFTKAKVQSLGLKTTLRMDGNTPFITDNQNYIIDLDYSKCKYNLPTLHNKLKLIHGVIETGYFAKFKKTIYICKEKSIQEINESPSRS